MYHAPPNSQPSQMNGQMNLPPQPGPPNLAQPPMSNAHMPPSNKPIFSQPPISSAPTNNQFQGQQLNGPPMMNGHAQNQLPGQFPSQNQNLPGQFPGQSNPMGAVPNGHIQQPPPGGPPQQQQPPGLPPTSSMTGPPNSHFQHSQPPMPNGYQQVNNMGEQLSNLKMNSNIGLFGGSFFIFK
jgi:hypothetical protein